MKRRRFPYRVAFFAMTLGSLLPRAAYAQQQDQQQSQPAQTQNSDKPKPSTASDNPFPEEISKKAAAEANAPATAKAPAPSADGSSSSRSSFSGITSPLDNESRTSDGEGHVIHNPKLAVEDVKVGGFYMDRKDYEGAYARYKEAAQVDDGNADAVLGLAKSAQALKHTQEAVDNYRVYLTAFPDGKKAKEASKALAELGAKP